MDVRNHVFSLDPRVFATLCASLCLACTRAEERFYVDGICRASGRMERGQPIETGDWTYWYPSGEPREAGRFEAGARVDVWTQWWPNGQRRSRGRREFDAAAHASPCVGPWTSWHANGVQESSGVHVGGEREGHWEFTLDDGRLDGDRTGEYHHGVKIDG